MISYRCKKCDNLVCETSVCQVCGDTLTVEKSEIYWCKKCNTPMFYDTCVICGDKGKYIGTDIRLVFPEERLLLEVLSNKEFEYAESSVWNTSGNNYIVNGKKIDFSIKEAIQNNKSEDIIQKIALLKEKNEKYVASFFDMDHIKNFIETNKNRLNQITNEATQYVKEVSSGYNENEIFISFSGGKDSTVTSELTMKALGKENIIHIYGDTTLEYPETEKYLKVFRKVHPATPMLIAKNKEQDFNELCNIIGPPSRVMRWCCTIFKTGAITRKIDSTFRESKNILTFYGIRRKESASRSKYDRESDSPKILKQRVVSPIIDWLDFDVWLYILSNKIEFNNAYRLGFSRVGCWCCPNNSAWSEFLSSIYMPNEYRKFHDILVHFSKNIGKPDPEEYVFSGGWKARQGGNGLEYSKNAIVEVKPCVLTENTFNFELNKVIKPSLYELFKVFGQVNYTIGNKLLSEVYILNRKTNEPILKLTGRIGLKNLKVTVVNFKSPFTNLNIAEILIKNQITKYQTCIGCLACESVCKYDAIKITNIQGNIEYAIDEHKCVGCLECVKHFSGGCLMKKILRTKKGDN